MNSSAILLTAIFGSLVLLICKVITSYVKMLTCHLPGPKPLPIIGNAHLFKTNGYDFNLQLCEWAEEYKKHGLFKMWSGNHLVVFATRADTAETLLSSTTLITKSWFYRFLHPWLSTGLLNSTGEKWQKRRKMLTPTFHFRILQDFVSVFNEQANILVAQLQSHVGNEFFDISQFITLCTLDIICETAMGKQLNSQTDHNTEYLEAVQRLSEIVMLRLKFPWYWPDFIFKLTKVGKEHAKQLSILHKFTNQVISDRRKENLMNKASKSEQVNETEAFLTKKRLAFLDHLLAAEGSDQLTNEDLREEVDTFMFEGHDTTASSIKWSIYMIGRHKNVQEKLFKEIESIFGESDREVTMEDINSMKYLEAVVKETLRLYPSVPTFSRTMTENCTFNNYMVPKGSTVKVIVPPIHRDPQYYPEPNSFNPERWLDQNTTRNPYSFIPFSAGMRNCIGQKFAMMEEKVVLSTLLRRYVIQSQHEVSDMRPSSELVLRPENGVFITLQPRIYS